MNSRPPYLHRLHPCLGLQAQMILERKFERDDCPMWKQCFAQAVRDKKSYVPCMYCRQFPPQNNKP